MTPFHVVALVAIAATALALTRANVVHGLLYLIVSLLAVAVIFFLVGAPLVAALEVIVYAGAIMVLFVFAVMLLNPRPAGTGEQSGTTWRMWAGPLVLTGVLVAQLVYVLVRHGPGEAVTGATVDAHRVGIDLFGRYAISIELASLLMLAGAVGAYHVGRRVIPRGEPAGAHRDD